MPASERLFVRGFGLLLSAQTVFGLAFSTFLLLPKYLATELAASPAHIGGVTSAFGLASMLLMPMVGVWVDRSSRSRFAVLGALLMGLSSLGFLLVERVGPYVYGLRFAQGAANALELVAMGALVVDLAPRHRMGQALGLFGMTMLSTNALAPALAEAVSVRFGWAPVFLAAAAVSFVAAALLARLGEHDRKPGGLAPAAGLWDVALTRRAAWYISISILLGTAFGAMFVFVQPMALELGRTQVSDFFVGYTVAAIVVRGTLGGLSDRWGRRRVAAGSMAVYAVSVSLTGVIHPAWLPWLGALFGLAHGLLYPAFNALVLDPVGPRERGKVFALFIAAFNGGWSLGGISLGWLAEATGYRPVFFCAGGAVALALLLLLSASDELVSESRESGASNGSSV